MPFPLLRKNTDRPLTVVILSAACCVPGMEAFDEAARRVVDKAIAETGVAADTKLMPATTAYFGGVPRQVMARLISLAQTGQMPVPAILINGEAVSYGVPDLELMKSALLKAAQRSLNTTEERANGSAS